MCTQSNCLKTSKPTKIGKNTRTQKNKKFSENGARHVDRFSGGFCPIGVIRVNFDWPSFLILLCSANFGVCRRFAQTDAVFRFLFRARSRKSKRKKRLKKCCTRRLSPSQSLGLIFFVLFFFVVIFLHSPVHLILSLIVVL